MGFWVSAGTGTAPVRNGISSPLTASGTPVTEPSARLMNAGYGLGAMPSSVARRASALALETLWSWDSSEAEV